MERKRKKVVFDIPEKYQELNHLIESLTHSGKKTLNKEELSKVFQLCGQDNDNISQSYRYIFQYLQKKHSEIRLAAVHLVHELFMKFEEFQKLVIENLHEFFKHTIGLRSKEPLPPPISVSKELTKTALQYFFDWHTKFNKKYYKLQLALQYLDTVEHVDFRTFEIVDPKERKVREEMEKTELKLSKARLDKSNKEMEELIPDIKATLLSLNSCFELLLPSPGDQEVGDAESNFDDLRLNGVVNLKHSLPVEIELSDKVPIKVDDENSAIIDAAKDDFTLINNRFLPKVKAWIETIIKGKGDKYYMDKASSLKKELELAITKYHRLDIIKPMQEEEEEVSSDSDLEEVELPKPPPKVVSIEESSLFSTTPSKKNKEERKEVIQNQEFSHSEPGPSRTQLNERKKKLLEIAPKLPFDVDLYHWEDENLSTPTVIATNTEGARFWGGGGEELIELPVPDGVSSLRTRVIEFSGEWEPVNHTCKAPLPSGKLCPRQDRYKCPFHGLIVERDDQGNIVNKDDEEKVAKSKNKPDVPDWQDPKLLAEIKAQTGLDLKMPEKGKKRKKQKKYPDLTDLKEIKNTPVNRISKKIFNKKAVMRVAATLDKIDQRKHRDKFGDQFNYVHGS